MSVRIVIDSTNDTTPEVRAKCTVVPLTVHFGEEEYVDGVTIDHTRFYEKLVSSDVLPTTSQPTPDAFSKVFKEAVDAGDQVVVITISAKLSGTYQSASIAAMDFPGSVYVVDSHNVAITAGILVERAVEMAESGMDAAAIAEQLAKEREDLCLIAVLDTLEYLKKGGRISKTVAFAGELLSIKPVISVDDGVINILAKARGTKQGNVQLEKQIGLAGGIDFSKPVLVGYTGTSDALLQKFLADSESLFASVDPLHSTLIGSVIGTHAGPGAYAVAFYRKKA